MSRDEPRPPPHARGRFARASGAVGLGAAVGAAVLLNVVVARHHKRFDWTSAHLYTPSAPTKDTLRTLPEPVTVNVLLAPGDPLYESVRQLLAAYQSESERLLVRYLDPDKHPAEFLQFREKYDLRAGRTVEGRLVADAAIVVVRGEKTWFLTPADLIDVGDEADGGKSRPKLEQALTTAIRNVLGGEKTRACVSKGHGELAVDDVGPQGLGEFAHRLERNNVEVSQIDSSAPDAKPEPWKGCDVVVVVAPQQPFSSREADAIAAYVRGGGGLLLFENPILDTDKKVTRPGGLGPVAALAGIDLRGDLVFERDPSARLPEGQGEAFYAQAKPHPITQGLTGERTETARPLVVLTQSLARLPSAPVAPADLLVTGDKAFGMVDFLKAPENAPLVERPGDHQGPLVVAMAAELPKPMGAPSLHGARMVVVGTGSVAQGRAWQDPGARGDAIFVESALSWVTSKPQIVDVPAKPAVAAGLRVTEESLAQVTRYVTLYIPLAAALIGLAVYLRRRSTERHRVGGPPAGE